MEFIYVYFGIYTMNLMKMHMTLISSLAKAESRVSFLKKCIHQNLVPTHLRFLIAKHIILRSFKSHRNLTRLNNIYIRKTLRLEQKDTYIYTM